MKITEEIIKELFDFKQSLTHNHRKGEFTFRFKLGERNFILSNKNFPNSCRLHCDDDNEKYEFTNSLNELMETFATYFIMKGEKFKQDEIKMVLGIK